MRAVTYIRMSREHQRYSPLNQQAALREYADLHGLTIVGVYEDEGRSGVTLKGRDGLAALLRDTLSEERMFDVILVLDVSRWGRFQDPDQAAHYEFVCRSAGVQVRYCAEPFENDGNPASTIIKHVKRVMAAEFSRELGSKVLAGQMRLAALGFKQGGTAPFGLRRLLVDEAGVPIRLLKAGEWKAVQTQRVVLTHGPPEEIRVVRRIFEMFASGDYSIRGIARLLMKEGCRDATGEALAWPRIRFILGSEVYAGVYTYNRTSQRLHRGSSRNKELAWVRSDMVKPIVSRSLFRRAQKNLRGARPESFSKAELLDHLRTLQRNDRPITNAIVNAAKGPCSATYCNRFGSLRAACELIGEVGHRAYRPSSNRRPPDEALLANLRRLLQLHGRLSAKIIDDSPGTPKTRYYRQRYGGLSAAYRAAGWHVTPDDIRREANRRRWARENAKLGTGEVALLTQ